MENHLRWFGYEGRGPTQTISDYATLNKKNGDKNRHDDRLLRSVWVHRTPRIYDTENIC